MNKNIQTLIKQGESESLEFKASFGKETMKTINLSWDFAQDPNHSINDISLEKVNQFIATSNRYRDYPIDDDPLTVLKKFELLQKNSISFGCFLLFCKQPSMISTIDAGCFDSETIIKDSITIQNDLFSEVKTCMDFVPQAYKQTLYHNRQT